MLIPFRYLALIAIFIASVSGGIGYGFGWKAKADSVANEQREKKDNADEKAKPPEQKAATASAEAKVVYKTVYRDVVKYVNDPNRKRCDFDADAVSMRQQAIDAANNIPGFDDYAVQDKQRSKQHR